MEKVIMREGGDTAVAEENSTYKSNANEKRGETSCIGEKTNEDDTSSVQLVSASVPANVDSAKAVCGADEGPVERGVAVAGRGRRPSAARALLSLAARGALALVAADVLVGRPLQRVSKSPAARFWAVGFIVGIVVFLTAASIGNQWKRRVVSIQPSLEIAGGSPQDQPIVLQVAAECQQTAEALSSLKSSHRAKQYVCEDTVSQKSSNNSSEIHLVRSLNDSVIIL